MGNKMSSRYLQDLFQCSMKIIDRSKMTLDCEFNGMVLGYKRLKSWVYISDKRLQTLCDFFFFILAVVLTDYLLLLV